MMGPLVHEPGTDWQYSTGIDWAGELLKRVSGKSLSQWSKEYIFDPLGADDIGYGVQPQHKGRLMAMHQRGKDGKLSVRGESRRVEPVPAWALGCSWLICVPPHQTTCK